MNSSASSMPISLIKPSDVKTRFNPAPMLLPRSRYWTDTIFLPLQLSGPHSSYTRVYSSSNCSLSHLHLFALALPQVHPSNPPQNTQILPLRRSRRSHDSSPQTHTLIGSKRTVPPTCGPSPGTQSQNTELLSRPEGRKLLRPQNASSTAWLSPPKLFESASLCLPHQARPLYGQTFASAAEVLLDACYRIAARVTIDRYCTAWPC